MRKQKYYQITTAGRVADINIYGTITSWPWLESDVSSFDIKKEIDGLDVDEINVYINSYGGEVAEALAIYTALKRHSAKVHTFCDGFACSAATIIFCAGELRTMSSLGLMMIHNCMSYLGYANSEEMRKAAEDNDKINQSSIEAYKKVSSLSEEEIKEMMNNETWLTAQECIDYGFATDIDDEDDDDDTPQQSAIGSIRDAIISRRDGEIKNFAAINEKLDKVLDQLQENDPEPAPEPDPEPAPEPEADPEPAQNKLGNIFTSIFK